jgi:hypothetical protein
MDLSNTNAGEQSNAPLIPVIRSESWNTSDERSTQGETPPQGDHPTAGRPQGCAPTMDEPNKALRRHSRGDGLSSPCGGVSPWGGMVALLVCRFVSPRLISQWSNELESINALHPYPYIGYEPLTDTSSTKKADVAELDDVVALKTSVTVCPP